MAELPPLSSSLAALRDHVLQHAVKRGDFTLKSGAKSSWFLDTKQTACRPEGIVLVADAMLDVIPPEATAIGGLTMGADPVAFGVAAIGATRGRQLRSFSVRKEAKDHGVTGRLAGALQPGDRVVITEDTVTRGTSIRVNASSASTWSPSSGKSRLTTPLVGDTTVDRPRSGTSSPATRERRV